MKLEVTVSPDRLRAILHIPGGVSLRAEELQGMVRDAGVVHGLDEEALAGALESTENDRQVCIAKGQAAVAARAGRLRPDIPPGELPRRVAAGEDLGEYSPARQALDGMGVNGEPLVANRIARLYDAGRGLRVADEHLLVERDGWLFLDGHGDWRVDAHGRPLTADEIELTIAADRTRVTVDVPAGCVIPVLEMRSLIQRHGISHGIDGEVVKAATQVTDEARALQVARATPARDGSDAGLESYVAEHPAFEPDANGNLDFKDYNSIVQVEEGTGLADLTPATAGVDGCDVLGQTIAATPGSEIKVERYLGEGVHYDAASGILSAARGGVLKRDPDGRIHVVQVVVVDGDVELRSGSISTDYAVIINGDITEGFTVKSGADIEVHGVIEDARVSAQGNIDVHGGILPGRQRVKAHGNISCIFAREREIKCQDLVVRESLSNCLVNATGSVLAKDIGGCRIHAADNVLCETLGNRIETETLVHVGVDPFQRSQVEEARSRKAQLEEELPRAKERAKLTQVRLDRLAKRYMGRPSPELKRELESVGSEARRALRAYREMADEIESCEATMKRLENAMYSDYERSHIKAAKTVFGNVTVRIGPTYYNTVHEQIQCADFGL
ncbi:MAG: FapA family protein [Planctomycetota bacterium]